ncbi:MAG: cation diffusion facilitator family transporter [Candidatus Kaiserbacteria bacterium]|nr:cation diffusion facilitator family transporter [Candidatus Kaiserbacteria bacterium]
MCYSSRMNSGSGGPGGSKGAHGFVPVLLALIGNILVTTIKTVVALSSGSSAMFSEAVHSVADTLNQLLLLVGVVRSRKKPSGEFVYGYGNERFFWALISACGIFFIGAGVTIYHGVTSLAEGTGAHITGGAFVVLGISFVIEFATFWVAARNLVRTHPDSTWLERYHEADPSTLAVCIEDGIAVLGVIVAAIAIALSYLTGNFVWDGIGSIVIGVMLAMAAIVLITKNRSYLIGRSIPLDERDEIIELLQADPAIERVIDFKSTILDIGVYRIKCEIEFNGPALMNDAYQQENLRDEYDNVKDDFEEFKKFCVDFSDRIPRMMGRRIDEIEARLKAHFPHVRYIDIEIN